MSDRDDDLVKIAVENYAYHSLNDEVKKICGRRLPIPYMFFIEGKINRVLLHNWMMNSFMMPWDGVHAN